MFEYNLDYAIGMKRPLTDTELEALSTIMEVTIKAFSAVIEEPVDFAGSVEPIVETAEGDNGTENPN